MRVQKGSARKKEKSILYSLFLQKIKEKE